MPPYLAESRTVSIDPRTIIIAIGIVGVALVAIPLVRAIIRRRRQTKLEAARTARVARIESLMHLYVQVTFRLREAQKHLKSDAAQNELQQCALMLRLVGACDWFFATDEELDRAGLRVTTAEFRLKRAERCEADPSIPKTTYSLGHVLRSDDTTRKAQVDEPE